MFPKKGIITNQPVSVETNSILTKEKIMWIQKRKAGALQYVLLIGVVISILLFVFIGWSHLNAKFRFQNNFFKEVLNATDWGVNYARTQTVPFHQIQVVQASKNPLMQTTLFKKQWGAFELLYSHSSLQKETFGKIALLGGGLSKKPSLYLKNTKRPLVVVGTTRVEGRVFLPNQQVKRGNIAGNDYYNSELIYGPVFKSHEDMPKIKNRSALQQIETTLAAQETLFFSLEFGMDKINSFYNATEINHAKGVQNLSDISLTGNICILSDTLIRVQKNCFLKEVLLLAPRIEIASGTQGSFQAIASQKIILGEGCQLRYPSVLLLCAAKETLRDTKEVLEILVKKGSRVQGVIAYLTDAQEIPYTAQITLEEGVVVDGELYCEANTDLQATVNGSVYTNGFVAKQFGSIYQNHLYNARINSSQLPTAYAGLQWENSHQNIAKWLY